MVTTKNPQLDVPPELRDFAEKSVEQTKKAVDSYLSAAQKAVGTIEGSAEAMQSGIKDLGKKAMGFAEVNVASSFELAQKLVRAKDVQEVMRIQAEFVQDQMKVLSEQAKELGTIAQKALKVNTPS
ncbi:phasin [Blastochloris sulfoviridis]|uniref:Phasin n=1 Tax=Blastochloris sulfoviridis TaxID=50712 RepID=A0A5M6HUB9_9HYPH|nr:phasin [Blastochloris sulfoviridis]KAA5599238.1 phasin [Blastochloris sulfoviridis]